MDKKYLLTGIIIIVTLVSACANSPVLECPKPTECPKWPEKICPSCPSCEEVKQQDKALIVEFKDTQRVINLDGPAHYYNAYSIINPNDRRVLVSIKTWCYDANDTETTYESKHFIDERSEYYNNYDGSHYYYATCSEGQPDVYWKKTRVEAKITD